MNAQYFTRQFDEVTDSLRSKLSSCRASRRLAHAEHARKEIGRIAKEGRHLIASRESGLKGKWYSESVLRFGPFPNNSATISQQLNAAEQIALAQVQSLLEQANECQD